MGGERVFVYELRLDREQKVESAGSYFDGLNDPTDSSYKDASEAPPGAVIPGTADVKKNSKRKTVKFFVDKQGTIYETRGLD